MFLMRMASGHEDDVMKWLSWSIVGDNANDLFRTQVVAAPTIASAGTLSWDTTTYDSVDIALGTPGTHTSSGGRVLHADMGSGRFAGGDQSAPDAGISPGVLIDNTSQIYALVVTAVGSNANTGGCLNFETVQ